MHITVFSFLMAVIWCTLFSFLITRLRGNFDFLKSLYLVSMVLLVLLTFGRFLLPIDAPGILVITSERVLPFIISALTYSFSPSDALPISILSLTVHFWLLGIAQHTVPAVKGLLKSNRYYRTINSSVSPQVERVIQSLEAFPPRMKVVQDETVSSPILIGLIRPVLFLPNVDLSDEQWRLIFKHELAHLKKKDLIIKLCVHVFHILFWWNPFITELTDDLDCVLEIQCDDAALKGEPRSAAKRYADALLFFAEAESRNGQPMGTPLNGLAFVSHSDETMLLQRGELILSHGKRKKKLCRSLGVIAVGIALVAVSYSFIFQPSYAPAMADDVFILPSGTTSFVELPDGRYELYIDDVFVAIVDNPDIIRFGAQIIKDRNDLP